jgi:uncharacterized protein
MRRRQASRLPLVIATIGATLALLAPADAQFWGSSPFGSPWGGRPQRQQPSFNPFGGFFDNNPNPQPQQPREPRPQREAPADFSRAPSPQKKPDTMATTPVLVLGDGMADWLAYGLEDAFSEKPEISIVRKNRTASGLIRYDTRREIEWPQVVREAIAAEKPKFIVMMLGVNDRQAIRERVPGTPATPARPGAAARNAPLAITPPTPGAPAPDPELQARESAQQQNAEQGNNNTEQPAAAPEETRPANTVAGNFDFHSEKWEAAYIKRIDATIVALKSANVPVLWVGLPAQRSGRASSDSAYLNELYRGRAEKAGVSYVDVWDGFVDGAGRFVVTGPDFEGQNRKLRAGDGVYFTKAGARKLAHYVEREIQRNIANRTLPVALPAPEPVAPVTAPGARPSGVAARPLAGPVVPLTMSTGGGDELLGGGAVRGAQPRPVTVDPIATRVLTKGESVAAPSGRADDFGWPRGAPRAAAEPAVELPVASAPAPTPVAAPSRPTVTAAAPTAQASEPAAEPAPAEPKPVRRKPAPRPVVKRDVRPEPFSPFGSAPGFWR